MIPTNFNRLNEQITKAARRSSAPPLLPALASLQGVRYPGPAVLGDARALSAFLLQRQLYQPGDLERTGWIVFAGESLRKSRQFEIQVDLGGGPRRIKFSFPNENAEASSDNALSTFLGL